MTPKQIATINKVIKVHTDLHGTTGMVRYAIVDDCIRKLKGNTISRKAIIQYLNKILGD